MEIELAEYVHQIVHQSAKRLATADLTQIFIECCIYGHHKYDIKPNKFIPTIIQVIVLRTLNPWLKLSTLNRQQWCQIMEWMGVLQMSEVIEVDQRRRCNELQRHITHQEQVVMLDGHGRMVYHWLKASEEKPSMRCRLLIPDINPIVHDWHVLCFPRKYIDVPMCPQNIFDTYVPDGSMYLYANFCGIGQQQVKLNQIEEEYMVSFSTSRAARHITETWKTNPRVQRYIWRRGEFVTLIIDRDNIKYRLRRRH